MANYLLQLEGPAVCLGAGEGLGRALRRTRSWHPRTKEPRETASEVTAAPPLDDLEQDDFDDLRELGRSPAHQDRVLLGKACAEKARPRGGVQQDAHEGLDENPRCIFQAIERQRLLDFQVTPPRP